jgi:hypothetical protein
MLFYTHHLNGINDQLQVEEQLDIDDELDN